MLVQRPQPKKPCICQRNAMQPFSFKYRVGPTLAWHDLWAPYINLNSLEIFLILGYIGYNNLFLKSFWNGIPLAFTEQIGTVYQMISVHVQKN